MNEKILAAKLFLLKTRESDEILTIIRSAQLLKGANLDLVLENYNAILEKALKIAEVSSSVELSTTEQDQIARNITSKFQSEKLVFVFSVKPSAKGLEIMVADNVVDFDSDEINI